MSPIRFRGGEFAFLDWIRAHPVSGRDGKGLLVGPGDDACVIDLGTDSRAALTTDMLLEGTHFDLATVSPAEVGWKSIGVSLSDIAAMGMEPVACLAAVGLPESRGRAFAEELYRGMRVLADRFGVPIAGGDVTSWREAKTVVCVTALGRCAGCEPVLRSGAREHDVIVVTGELGGSLLSRHVRFIPRVQEALAITRGYSPHAMIDISDGLSSDLAHIALESGVAAVLDESRIPVSADARKASTRDGRSALEHALHDGEDFELLLTMAGSDARRLIRDKPFETKVTVIGSVREGNDLFLRGADGGERVLEVKGYEHLCGE
jgi:thiamine-monophosphate kinase